MQRRIALGALAATLALSLGLSAQAAPILGVMNLDIGNAVTVPLNATDLTTVTGIDVISGPGVTHQAAVGFRLGDYTGIPFGTVVTFTAGAGGHDINLTTGATPTVDGLNFTVGAAPGTVYGSFLATTGVFNTRSATNLDITWTGVFTPSSGLPTVQANPFTTVRFNLLVSGQVGGTTVYNGGFGVNSPAVPEPTTVLGLLCGLPFLGLMGYRSLRRRSA